MDVAGFVCGHVCFVLHPCDVADQPLQPVFRKRNRRYEISAHALVGFIGLVVHFSLRFRASSLVRNPFDIL